MEKEIRKEKEKVISNLKLDVKETSNLTRRTGSEKIKPLINKQTNKKRSISKQDLETLMRYKIICKLIMRKRYILRWICEYKKNI